MLSELGSEEGDVKFGIPLKGDEKPREEAGAEQTTEGAGYAGVDWSEQVSGTKRVLSMDVSGIYRFANTQAYSSLVHTSLISSPNCAQSTSTASGARTSTLLSKRWTDLAAVLEKTKMTIEVA